MPSPFRLLAMMAIAGLLLPQSINLKSYGSLQHPFVGGSKVPLATGNGPLDAPFLTVFLPPQRKDQWRFGDRRARWREHHDDVRIRRIRDRRAIQRLGRRSVRATYRLSRSMERTPGFWTEIARATGAGAGKRVGLDPGKIGFAGSPPVRRWDVRGGCGQSCQPGRLRCTRPVGSRPDYLVLVYARDAPDPVSNFKVFRPRFFWRLQPIRETPMAQRSFSSK